MLGLLNIETPACRVEPAAVAALPVAAQPSKREQAQARLAAKKGTGGGAKAARRAQARYALQVSPLAKAVAAAAATQAHQDTDSAASASLTER